MGRAPWRVVGAGPWHSDSTGLSVHPLVACGVWEEPAAGWAGPREGPGWRGLLLSGDTATGGLLCRALAGSAAQERVSVGAGVGAAPDRFKSEW